MSSESQHPRGLAAQLRIQAQVQKAIDSGPTVHPSPSPTTFSVPAAAVTLQPPPPTNAPPSTPATSTPLTSPATFSNKASSLLCSSQLTPCPSDVFVGSSVIGAILPPSASSGLTIFQSLSPSTGLPTSQLPAQTQTLGPSHKINGGAIAGGAAGALFFIGAGIAIAVFLRRRFLRSRSRTLTSAVSDMLPGQEPALNVTAEGETVLAYGRPVAHGVVETQEAILSKIAGGQSLTSRPNGPGRSQNVAGATADPVAIETQMRAMAEALMEMQLQMRSLADEQPPGYYASNTTV